MVNEEFDSKVEAGYVISQDVDPETEVGAGSTVTITVSKGVETSTVPNVVGKSEADAKSEIESAGLTVSATLTDEDRTKDNGVVLKQSLEAGTSVEKGSSMTITVNQIAELKNATVKINLKSLIGYSQEYENVTNTISNSIDRVPVEPDTVEVRVVVDDKDTVYSKEHEEDETNITTTVEGVGTITVKVYVDDVLKGTKQVNLNNQSEITFE